MGIFKNYDVRGKYPGEINEEVAYKIGRALVKFLGAKEIVVGYDMRDSSIPLSKAFIKGVNDEGANVINIGLCSTPMLYFAAKDKEGAAMITASHNPKEYNGIKLCGKNAVAISGDTGIYDIKKIVDSNNFTDKNRVGKTEKKDVKQDYVDHVLKFSKGIEGSNVVIDFGNGMGGLEFPLIFDKLDVKKEYLFKDLDGNFPNHEPNPVKLENLKDLSKKVIENKADLGLATDGDCDRVGFVDEKGNMVPGDLITALIGEELLKHSPKEKILYEVRSSRIVKETIEKNGGIPIVWKPGHSFIKDKMRSDKILFGGEMSGHYFFRDNWYFESSIMAAIQILKLLREKNKKLSELVKPLLIYHKTPEINFEVENKDKTLEKIEKSYPDGKVIKIDGLTIEFEDWWFNLRKSNTEPVIRLNLEANTKEKMQRELNNLKKIILS